MQEMIKTRAAALLSDGTADRVLAWKRGLFGYDVTPAVFHTDESLCDLVYSDFCGANLSKYLIGETRRTDSRVLVFLKPCDTYSFNQLLTEHRFEREKVYAIGVPCAGMVDIRRIRALAGEDISSVTVEGETVTVHTLYDGDVTLSREDCLPDRCKNCKSKKHMAYDEMLGEDGEVLSSARFDEVEKLEAMTEEERFAFWQNELSRCIRCNACRDACPACTCEKCVFDNPQSGVQNKAAADPFEEKLFHIIRAFHVAGRCTDCGECSRVCPQQIPLHLLNRKFIKDINEFYDDYQAGESVGQRMPLVDFTEQDPEAGQKGGRHA
ncbi:MAG: 4Fe-4S dicluster domain-containing protein [Clostridia bacterium]|nr:4Fe-4S dicluster domain-containing protein [Clostridia bacterium]